MCISCMSGCSSRVLTFIRFCIPTANVKRTALTLVCLCMLLWPAAGSLNDCGALQPPTQSSCPQRADPSARCLDTALPQPGSLRPLKCLPACCDHEAHQQCSAHLHQIYARTTMHRHGHTVLQEDASCLLVGCTRSSSSCYNESKQTVSIGNAYEKRMHVSLR